MCEIIIPQIFFYVFEIFERQRRNGIFAKKSVMGFEQQVLK